MKKLITGIVSLSTVLVFSAYSYSEKECQNYVKKVEECIKKEKSGDLNTKWRKCETQVITNLIQEEEDQGNCFSFEECRDYVMQEIKACGEERKKLYNKLLRENH